ncbi:MULTISPECIES: hypothetical protein [unclassified Streptomyces]|uniref:hypothetical protein n=1 Tax=unclassified Streptomyces TaxID=2593676 RepID=UPI0008DD18A0|nr:MULTISPECIES: hypothetical protein [unclassified Streptomyces]OII64484.1 hypothetical protein BJP39_01780 [Streptomyces sp. CC77]
MVSSPHEAMHRIFQEFPELFSRVSQALGIDLPQPSSVKVLPNDLTENRPVERRVDTLLHFESETDGGFLIAVEAQGKKDATKAASWAYYVSYLCNKHGLPPLLLVVCQDRATAEWAAQPVRIGPDWWPTLTLQPLVVGPHNLPAITDPVEAQKDLAFAALSAITHASDPEVAAILKALSTALRDMPEDLVNPVVEFTAQGLGNRRAKDIWRNLVAVDLSFYHSYLSDGIRAESRAEDILLILEERGLAVSDSVRERVSACEDPAIMRSWLLRALTATTAEEIFGDA